MKRITIILWAIIAVVGTSVSAQTVWYDPMQAGDEPYVEGRAWNKEIGKANYSRLPDRFEGKVSKHVWTLSKHTAGMSVRFFTTAKKIKVRFINVNAGKNYPNVVSLNHSGVDLYATDVEGNTTWVPNMMKYTFSVNGSDTAQFVYDTREMPVFKRQGMYYELYLPSYNGIKWLSVGVDKNERFEFIRGSQERPIVVYGTSIAHGASASRPGLIWTTLLKRRYDIPFINLGFSGSAKMENIMYDALSEIEARAYIIDCIPNCEGLDNKEFASRVEYGIRKLREKSGAPIIFMEGNAIAGSSTHLHRNYYEQHEKDSIQYEVYMRMKALGFKNMYYITHEQLGFTAEDLIEGTHPNDVGMHKYAAAYAKVLDPLLIGSDTMKCFTPCIQHRDGSYEWMTRHNEILALNHTIQPEILMIGNSITHFWGGEPQSRCNGGKTWQQLFGKHRVVNMGMGWDRVENVYWRLSHGELEGCRPSQICLLIGINNRADSDERIVSGICDIVALIRKRQPQARLHVVEIYPCKGSEERVRAINTLLRSKLPLDDMTDIQDVSSALILDDGSGRIDPTCFVEGLHPNEKGYGRLARLYRKFLFGK